VSVRGEGTQALGGENMKASWLILVVCVWEWSGGLANTFAQSSAPAEKASLENLVKRAEELLKRERYEEVITLLEPEVSKYPQSSDVRYYLGLAYFEIRKYEKAMQWMIEADRVSPKDEDVAMGLALCYLSVGKLALGLQKARQAVSLSPNDLGAQRLLGVACVLNSDGRAAVPILEKVAKQAENQTTFYALAAAYRMVGQERDAQQALRQAWRIEDRLDSLSLQRQQVVRGLRRHESQRLIVLLPPLSTNEVERVLRQLDQVYKQVAEMLQCQSESKMEVVVYPDEATFRRLYPNSAISTEADSRRLIIPSPFSVIDDAYNAILIAGMIQQFATWLSDGHVPFWLSKGLRLTTVKYEGKTDFTYTLARKLEESKNVALSTLELFPYEDM